MTAQPVVAAFDTETTGVDVESDRIVSAAIVALAADGTVLARESFLFDPQIEIPEEATAVHGITTAHAREYGHPPAELATLADGLGYWLGRGVPIVTYNAPFDWTLLDREIRRHKIGGPKGGWGLWFEPRPIFDPLIIDKGADKFRKGSRRLGDVAAHYGVTADGDLHGAEVDAILAGRLWLAMLDRIPNLRAFAEDPQRVHDALVIRAAEQAKSFAVYLRSKGEEPEPGREYWPLRPFGGQSHDLGPES